MLNKNGTLTLLRYEILKFALRMCLKRWKSSPAMYTGVGPVLLATRLTILVGKECAPADMDFSVAEVFTSRIPLKQEDMSPEG